MTQIFNKKSQTETRKILREAATEAEKILWSRIQRNRIKGCRFRRQYGVGAYIVDFYCPTAHLVIEVDGGIHNEEEVALNDTERQKDIEALGITFLRFTNEEIFSNVNSVIEKISSALLQAKAHPYRFNRIRNLG